jgi:hypothetical protein
MNKLERLQHRLGQLQEIHSLVMTKLGMVEQQHKLETRMEEKLRLNAFIENNKRELASVEVELDDIEAQIAKIGGVPQPAANPQQSHNQAPAQSQSQSQTVIVQVGNGAQASTAPAAKKTILILAANPGETARLQLGKEIREIQDGLQRARHRDSFTLEQRHAVRPRDLQRALLDYEPQFAHFCGHGEKTGLVLENDNGGAQLASPAALSSLFELFAKEIQCVLLNACYSESQAQAIAQHIPYVIGMSDQISDKAAIEFAVAFYDAIGAGKNVEFAYKLGCNAIQMAGLPEELTPVLIKR